MPSSAESTHSLYREVFRFVRRRVASRETAEDLTQEVFANAAEALARSASESPPSIAWFYTVARRRLIDEARRRRRSPTVPLESVPDLASAASEYGIFVARALREGMAKLPPDQRRVVQLRLLQGRTFRAIGRDVGATEEACRMRFMRGIEQLRILLEEEGLKP